MNLLIIMATIYKQNFKKGQNFTSEIQSKSISQSILSAAMERYLKNGFIQIGNLFF